MKPHKHAFTLVEVLIAISIVIVLASISVTSYFSQVDKSNNSLTQAKLESLSKFLKIRATQEEPPPLPAGNLTLYHEDTSLSPTIEEAFSVSGFFSDTTFTKDYVGFKPVDEKTGQFFGFGVVPSLGTFQIAGVMTQDSAPISKVVGNHSGKIWPYNLVRHYAWGDFVPDKSREYFPYDPEELVMHARITSMTGSVEVNGTSTSQTGTELYEGDTVKTSTWGHATIYFSDGSKVVLWDASQASSFTLARLRYSAKDNLSTQIRLVLDMGQLWSRVSKLTSESEFEVGTTDAIATVRGTNFGVVKEAGSSSITLQEGKLEVSKTTDINTFVWTPFTMSGGVLTLTWGLSYLEVASWEDINGIKVNSPTSFVSSTWGLLHLPTDQKDKLLKGLGEINESVRLMRSGYEFTDTWKTIDFVLTDTLKQAKTIQITTEQARRIYVLSDTGGAQTATCPFPQTMTWYTLTLDTFSTTGCLTPFKDREYVEVKFCDEQCTQPFWLLFWGERGKAKMTSINSPQVQICPEGYEKIAGRCVENSLSGSGYDVIWYAPLDYTLDMYTRFHERITPTSSWVTFSWGGVDRGTVVSNATGSYLHYDLSTASVGWNFAIEMEVRGEDLMRSWNYYLFFSNEDLRIYKSNNSIKVFSTSNFPWWITTSTALLNWFTPYPNRWYKVRLVSEYQKLSVTIDDQTFSFSPSNYTNELFLYDGYVGNCSFPNWTYWFQWNGPIRNFKLYRKQ